MATDPGSLDHELFSARMFEAPVAHMSFCPYAARAGEPRQVSDGSSCSIHSQMHPVRAWTSVSAAKGAPALRIRPH